MEIDVARQRLDSTHVFSNMATFGRTRLLAIAAKRFLTQLLRHAKDDFNALPDDFRSRYAVSESRLFADSKTPESRIKSRQQAAEGVARPNKWAGFPGAFKCQHHLFGLARSGAREGPGVTPAGARAVDKDRTRLTPKGTM